MIYSSRLKKILEVCLMNQGEHVTFDDLAERLKTSRRTIFRELHDVDEQLKPYGVRLVTQSGKGIQVEGDEEHCRALLQELHASQIQYLNKEDRQNMLIFELLRSDELQKLIHYANIFQVSEATISNDLETISTWFQHYHIEIQRKPGLGVVLVGNEADKRKAMTSIVHDHLHDDNTYIHVNYLDSQKLLEQIFMNTNQNSIMKLLNQEILERILHVFHQYQHELQLDRYAQSSYIGLIIHLAVAIDRIQKHEKITQSESVFDMIKDDVSYQTANSMAKAMEVEFDIEIPMIEVAFIALHIKGAKINSMDEPQGDDEHIQTLAQMIHRMLENYDEDIRWFLQQDERLFQGLLTHLEPALTRLKHSLNIYNPLLKQLKEQYPSLFQQSRQACRVLEQEYDCVVSDDEVGYITMHVGAALERINHVVHRRVITIGVVCASGIGVSALLSARIANTFHDDVVLKTLSMDHVISHQFYDCEALISTFELDDTVTLPHIQVDPLLNKEDCDHITTLLELVRSKDTMTQQHETHDFYEQLTQLKEASTTCLQLYDHLTFIQVGDDSTIPQVIEIISHTFGCGDQVAQITQSLYQREALGSVIMNTMGFALLHAKSEGMDHAVMGVCYPQTSFQETSLMDIHYILVLLMPMDAGMITTQLMAQLSRGLLEDREYQRAIEHKDTRNIKNAMTRLFQTVFEQFE